MCYTPEGRSLIALTRFCSHTTSSISIYMIHASSFSIRKQIRSVSQVHEKILFCITIFCFVRNMYYSFFLSCSFFTQGSFGALQKGIFVIFSIFTRKLVCLVRRFFFFIIYIIYQIHGDLKDLCLCLLFEFSTQLILFNFHILIVFMIVKS